MQWQPGTPAMAAGMMDSVWTMEALLARSARPVSGQRHCVVLSSTLSRDTIDAGGTLENAQLMAAHESPRTTKLYDRTGDEITLDEVERIRI
jgi:hypothetical protein